MEVPLEQPVTEAEFCAGSMRCCQKRCNVWRPGRWMTRTGTHGRIFAAEYRITRLIISRPL